MYVDKLFMCFLYTACFSHIHLKTYRLLTTLYIYLIESLTFSSCCKWICSRNQSALEWKNFQTREFNTPTNQTWAICTTPPELSPRLPRHDNPLCWLCQNLPPHSWKMHTRPGQFYWIPTPPVFDPRISELRQLYLRDWAFLFFTTGSTLMGPNGRTCHHSCTLITWWMRMTPKWSFSCTEPRLSVVSDFDALAVMLTWCSASLVWGKQLHCFAVPFCGLGDE